MAESSQLRETDPASIARPDVEQILESAAEGIHGLDRDGRITFVNAAAVRLTGWSRAQQLGRDQIDQEFVRDALTDENDAAIVRTIIVLAQTMGLEMLAEGVEHEAMQNLLAHHGCSACQGFLFGGPVPVHELERQLFQ